MRVHARARVRISPGFFGSGAGDEGGFSTPPRENKLSAGRVLPALSGFPGLAIREATYFFIALNASRKISHNELCFPP